MKYKLITTYIEDKEDVAKITYELQGKDKDGVIRTTPRKLKKLINSGEVELVNFKLNENGNMKHIFGLCEERLIPDNKLIYNTYIVRRDYNNLIGSNRTYGLIGEDGRFIGIANEADVCYIISYGKTIKNIRVDIKESEGYRTRDKKVIEYHEFINSTSLENRANKAKDLGDANCFDSNLNTEYFWGKLNTYSSLQALYEKGKEYQYMEQIVNRIAYDMWYKMDEYTLYGFTKSMERYADVLYTHDSITKGKKQFFEIFGYNKKIFNQMVCTLMIMYGEDVCKQFMINPEDTIKKHKITLEQLETSHAYLSMA